MRKLTAGLVVIVAVAAFAVGTAAAGPGGTDRPYECRGTGTLVFDLTAGTVTGTLEQVCTHLGRTTGTWTAPFSPTGSTFEVENVAANGDVLAASVVSAATVLSPTHFTFVNDSTVTGGSGRFSGATGGSIATGHAFADPSNPLLYHTTFTASGTLSY